MAKKRASLSDNNPLGDMFTRSAPRDPQPAQETPPAPEIKPEPPPPVEETKTVQTTIILTADQLDWLDYVSFDSKRGNGRVISKSELFREMIDFLRTCDLSLRDLQTSEDIQKRLRECVVRF